LFCLALLKFRMLKNDLLVVGLLLLAASM
jgi:hypothetical protein